MGYQFWDGIPRKADDPTRIAAYVAAQLATQNELSELADVNIPAPADGEVLTYDTGTSKWIAAAAGGNGDLSWSRHWRIGRNHLSPLYAGNWGNTLLLSTNVLYGSSFPIPTGMTFDRLSVYTATTAVASARLGIYADDGNAYPGALELDAGIVDLSGAGFKQIVINKTLTAGLYWLAILFETGISIYVCGQVAFLSVIGFDGSNLQQGTWYVNQAYGALPDPFPGGASTLDRILHLSFRRSA